MDQLKINVNSENEPVLLNIEGTLNSYTYTDFQKTLYELIQKGSVGVKMSQVNNISSAGIGVLMAALEMGEEEGHRLFIVQPSDIVTMAIESTGFQDMFQMVDSPEKLAHAG